MAFCGSQVLRGFSSEEKCGQVGCFTVLPFTQMSAITSKRHRRHATPGSDCKQAKGLSCIVQHGNSH